MDKERKLVIAACIGVVMLTVIFVGISFFDWFSGETAETEERKETREEVSTQTGEYEETTEEPEGASTEEPTSQVYPENAVFFRHYGELMDYFRCAVLRFLDIPGELERTCYVEAYLPELTNQQITYIDPVICYDKKYRAKTTEISWEGGWNSNGKLEYIYDVIALAGSSLEKDDEDLSNQGGYFLKISGTLSEERVTGEEKWSDLWGLQNSWGRFLEAAGHWYVEQTGKVFDQLKGEIYLTADRAESEGWICLAEMEPIKVSLGYDRELLIEAPGSMEEAELAEEEKSGCLFKLTFDLKVEDGSGGGNVTEKTTEADPTTEESTAGETDYPNLAERQGRMTYLRSVALRGIRVPEELGDSCFVELCLPVVSSKKATNTDYWILYDREYCYENESISWEIEWDTDSWEVHSINQVRTSHRGYELRKISETLNGSYFCKISGTISQELCPAGQSEAMNRVEWGRFLEAAGHYYTVQNGENTDWTLAGEIYCTRYGAYEGWICLAGMEPIKVVLDNEVYAMSGAPEPIKGVEFTEEEKEKSLFKLTFNLTSAGGD